MDITLTANGSTEQRILDYLKANASEVLAAKINGGKKTLGGAMRYAKDEARTLANGEGCVCVDDATVFGWIVHYFEEDTIEEEKAKAKPAVRLPSKVKPKAPAPAKQEETKPAAQPEPPKQPEAQMDLFTAMMGESK